MDGSLVVALCALMLDQFRLEYPGALSQAMSRGNRREQIFLDHLDRQDFLKTLTEACQKTDLVIHGAVGNDPSYG
jgi:hypothetical protein